MSFLALSSCLEWRFRIFQSRIVAAFWVRYLDSRPKVFHNSAWLYRSIFQLMQQGHSIWNLKVPSVRPDWICMRVVSLESPLKGHQPLQVCFNFFIFDLEYLKQLQSSEPLHAKRPLILLLVRFTVCMCSSRNLFRQTVLNICGRDINCSLDCSSQVKNSIIPQPKLK